MTDRTTRLTVVLDKEIRTDDVEPLVNAIKQMRGVCDVGINVVTPDDWTALVKAKADLGKRLWDVLYGDRQITGVDIRMG